VSVEAHGVRLDKVEGEITTVRTEMAGLKAQMRGFGDVLERIERGVASAQQQFHDDKQAARINPIALATILISIISILVGGAWLISGGLATSATRLEEQDKSLARISGQRDREFDVVERRLERMEDRANGRSSPPNQQ
jgi:hypothetical protein